MRLTMRQWFGIILIAVGALVLSNVWPHFFSVKPWMFSSESLLILFSLMLMVFAWNRALELLLPALILFGIGIHAFNTHFFHLWPDQLFIYAIIIGLAMVIYGVVAKSGVSMAWGSALIFFAFLYEPLLSLLHDPTKRFLSFWPLLLIAIGVFLLLDRRGAPASVKRRRR